MFDHFLLETSRDTTLIQAVGILLVAALLLPIARAIPGRFLRYWALGWIFLTCGLFSLYGSYRIEEYRIGFLIGYCIAEYLFGFLLWAGCRDFATGLPIRLGHVLAMGPAAIFGIAGPILLKDIYYLFPFHSLVVGTMFVSAFAATFKFQVKKHTPTTGLWLLRICLAGLSLLFWHYSLVAGYSVYVQPEYLFQYLSYSSLYDVAFETGLAFAMITLSVDRMREELEDKNRRLAMASEELAFAARTDALTGLLNRRAFDDLLADRTATTSGSLAVLDLNNLKPINDMHGHSAGDAALQVVARALRNHFRVTDPIFRTGGDEFVIVMVGCTEADLAVRMTQVDQALHEQRLPGVSGTLDLTAAWGVATFDSAASLTLAFQRADETMYACKRVRKSTQQLNPTGPPLTGL